MVGRWRRSILFFPSYFVWNPWFPTKVSFFAWEAFWGRILTLNQLKKRGRALANIYFLCGEGEVIVDHLLVDCPVAWVVWELLLVIFGVSWVFPLTVRETLLLYFWMAVPLCICWTIWRNRLVFDNVDISIIRMKLVFLCNLWSWGNLYIVDRSRSVIDFLYWLGCK